MQSKKDLYQIGEVARLFHLSISLLRHYDKTGLVTPEYTDPDTGYRYYSIRQFECLNTIRYLRALAMPLDEIGDFLHNRDTGRIHDFISNIRLAAFFGCGYIVSSIGEAHLADQAVASNEVVACMN